MYNVRSRLTVIWTQAFNVMMVCALALAAQSFINDTFWPAVPTAHLAPIQTNIPIVKANLGHEQMNNLHQVERTVLRMNIKADFTPCFTWNTKMVFAYIKVSYQTAKWRRNEMTIWDKRITKPEEAKIYKENALEYPIDAIEGDSLRGVTVTAVMMYQTMYYSGYAPLREVPGSAVTVTLPSDPVEREIRTIL